VALREHGELTDAIEQRRADDACRIAHAHFVGARDIRLALIAETPVAAG